MATEILGFLIIVGILIVFIVRRDLWNGTSNKADEVEEASVKMRLQMEHSANAIITQMDARIHQLEGLVTAADERARMLEQQMAAVRADQERAQQQAEKAFAEMRAVHTSYYTPQEETPMPPHRGPMRGNPWTAHNEYRARVAASERSLRPIEGVSSVRRSEYASRVRSEGHGAGPDFAETLSASMYAAEAGNGVYRRSQPRYYDHGQPPVYEPSYPRNERYPQDAVYSREDGYDERAYDDNYAAASYPMESYPEEETETWEQYVEQPRRTAAPQGNPQTRRTQVIPAELAVEETPAVIVESKMMQRQEAYAQEEPEDEGPAFSSEQLEELARTEAEVVVSSSVADVVDLPMASPETEEPYDDEEDEDIHAIAETDDGDSGSPVLTPSDEELNLANENDVSETAQSGRFEEQDLFGEEEKSESERSDAEEASFASSEEVLETAEAAPDETASAAAEESVEEIMSTESEAAAWAAVSTEPPLDDSEAPAGGMNETMDEDEDYETPENKTDVISEEDVGPRSPSPTIRARELLAQGMSPEEVAKETGMGRSAVELLAQMAQGTLNSQGGD